MEREIDQINHRFDDLSHQMDRRFDEQSHQMDRRFEEQSHQMDRRFEEQNKRLDEQGDRFDELSRRVEAGFGQFAGRLDALQRTLIQIAFGALFTFVASVIGYFLTQH